MWCPKCKTEYRQGITVCSDCGAELVDKKYGVDICEISDEKAADEIVEYLKYSGVHEVEKEADEDGKSFCIMVSEKDAKNAERLFHGYMLAKEEEKEAQETSDSKQGEASANESVNVSEASAEVERTEERDGEDSHQETAHQEFVSDTMEEDLLKITDIEENSAELLHSLNKKEYVKKAEVYKDLKFSGITFIVFGIIGVIYLILSKTEVIPIQYNIVIFCIIAILFAAFIIGGIVSIGKAYKVKPEIAKEEAQTKEMKEWLTQNITKEVVENWVDQGVSDVENDLLLAAHIRNALMKEYAELDRSYLEMIADEYYEENFVEKDMQEE